MEAINKYYTDVISKHYFDFDGRATRQEFWMFVLFNFIAAVLVGFINGLIFGDENMLLGNLYSLAVLLPSLGIAARRLHDIGKSAWWLLIGLIPFIGWIVLLVFYVMPTKK